MRLRDVIDRGTLAERGAPGIEGSLFYVTDEATLYRDNGLSWENIEFGGVTSSGVVGQVAYWTGTNSLAGDTGLIYTEDTGSLVVTSLDAANVPLTARAAAGQAANLHEWKDSAGIVLSSVASDGKFQPDAGMTSPYTNWLVVDAGSLGDYTSIKDAIDMVKADTPSAVNTWAVFVTPGVYADDMGAGAAYHMPSYTSLIGAGKDQVLWELTYTGGETRCIEWDGTTDAIVTDLTMRGLKANFSACGAINSGEVTYYRVRWQSGGVNSFGPDGNSTEQRCYDCEFENGIGNSTSQFAGEATGGIYRSANLRGAPAQFVGVSFIDFLSNGAAGTFINCSIPGFDHIVTASPTFVNCVFTDGDPFGFGAWKIGTNTGVITFINCVIISTGADSQLNTFGTFVGTVNAVNCRFERLNASVGTVNLTNCAFDTVTDASAANWNDKFEAQTYVAPTAASVVHTVKGAAAQSSDLHRWTDSADNILSRINKDGYIVTSKITEPIDGDLSASELAFWFDSTDGNAFVVFKGKTADGTVVSGIVALT